MFPVFTWSANADTAIAEALEKLNLVSLGWKGFEDLEWVRALKEKYPVIDQIATNTSTISGIRLAEVKALLILADACDHSAIRSYFVAKMALEKLSCARNGAGAGMGDKLGAYLQIFETTTALVG